MGLRRGVSGMTRRPEGFTAEALECSLSALLEMYPVGFRSGSRSVSESALDAGRLWIAYSGGLDSSVLLHAAVALSQVGRHAAAGASGPKVFGRELRAIHIDHGLHAQSAQWACHCRMQCARLGVPLIECPLVLHRQAGESLEAVARSARYAAFAKWLEPGDAVAAAQHRDDQAETLLLALLRGSGVHGLASMPARSRLGVGLLVRPLLAFGRADLETYARQAGLSWVEDPSNCDVSLDRNLLRHQVLPRLRSRWPACDLSLARSATHSAEAASLLDGLADELLELVPGARPGTLSIQKLSKLPEPRRRLVLRRWLVREGFQLPSSDRIRRIICELMPAAADRAPLVAWRGCEIRRYRDDLYALLPLPPVPDQVIQLDRQLPLQLPAPLGRLCLPSGFEAEGLLSVCFRRPGLRCRTDQGAGADFHRGLKKLFQQAGVPGWIRPYVPLVLVDAELGAVAGLSVCDGRLAGVRWEGHPWERFGLFSGSES